MHNILKSEKTELKMFSASWYFILVTFVTV